MTQIWTTFKGRFGPSLMSKEHGAIIALWKASVRSLGEEYDEEDEDED